MGERQITISMIEGLAEVLDLNYRDLQIKFIAEKIINDFENQPFLEDALNETLKNFKAYYGRKGTNN